LIFSTPTRWARLHRRFRCWDGGTYSQPTGLIKSYASFRDVRQRRSDLPLAFWKDRPNWYCGRSTVPRSRKWPRHARCAGLRRREI
jgi:hypothetical protein